MSARTVPILRVVPAALLAALAQPAPGAEPATLAPNRSNDALAGTLRGLIVRHAPNPLYEASRNWGDTKEVVRGLRWTGRPLPLRPEVVKGEKKHGKWRRVRVTADDLANTLVFDLRHVRQHEPGRKTFDVFASFDARVFVDQERWRAGLKTFDFSARARLRVKLHLACEVTTRLQPNGTLFPDALFRLRVTRADLRYDNLVVEHIAGLGGTAAKVLGEAVHNLLDELKPSLEPDLLARANAAIVKAGDTKEVKLSLTNFFERPDALAESALNLLPGPKKK
jgi:hypothetical protein